MYLDFLVNIPNPKGKITYRKKGEKSYDEIMKYIIIEVDEEAEVL